MNYLDSPTRRSDINNTSPLTLFDSPSRSGNRYNYQALSCESPPANFEDLRTPMQVPRPSLDWTRAITTTPGTLGRSIFSSNYNRSSSITTNENKDVEKIQPLQQEQKILTSPMKEKNSSLIKSSLKSPLRINEKWNTFNEEDDKNKEEKNLMTLDASPINSSLPKIDYKIAHSTPVRQEFQYTPSSDNSSPIKFSPLVKKDFNKNSPTDISQQLHYTLDDDNNKDYTTRKSITKSLDSSPIKKYDIKYDLGDDKDDKRGDLSFSKAKSDTDNSNDSVKDHGNNKNDKKEDEPLSFLYKSYSERLATSTTKSYSSYPLTISDINKQEKENDDINEYMKSSSSTPPPPSPQKQQIPSTYRSPVYSNSSYKSSDKKQSPAITPQKTISNNIDDTIKQSSILKSPLKLDNTGNISNISLLSPSYSTTQYINHMDNKNNNSNYNSDHDNENSNYIYGNNDYNDNENHQQQKETTVTNPKSSFIATTTLKKDKQHEEINTQTSSQGSNISKSSSKRRYKYINAELPHYMRSTESFQNRIHTSESNTKLHKTISGGITKRSSSNTARFKSTTKINAIDDIRNEMTPEDVYIPLAARVKLFEKGLGNGIKPTPINNQKQSNITSSPSTHRLTKPKSPQLLTRQRSFSSSHNCNRTDELSSVPRPPSVLENEGSAKDIKHTNQRKHTEDQTYTTNRDNSNNNSHRVNKRPYPSISSSSISTVKNDHHVKKGENKKQRRHDHPPLEVKPFHFATDKRAARYQELFRTKLKLWKEKENQEKPAHKRHKY